MKKKLSNSKNTVKYQYINTGIIKFEELRKYPPILTKDSIFYERKDEVNVCRK